MKNITLALSLIINISQASAQIISLNKNVLKFENYYFSALNTYFSDDSTKLFYYAHLATKYNPKSAATYFLLGKYLYYKKHYQIALEYFEKATKLNQQNFWYKYYLAQTYIKLNDIDNAIKILQKLAVLYPSKSLYLKIIDLYIKQNDYNKAKSLCNNYSKLFGLDLYIGLKLITIYKKTKESEKLQTTLEKLIKNYPTNRALFEEYWNTINSTQNYNRIIKFYHTNKIFLTDYVFILLTKAFYKLNNKDSALYYEKKLLMSPEIPVSDKLATIKIFQQLPKQQILKLYQLLYNYYPYNQQICFNYGLFLYKNFFLDKSYRTFKQCLGKSNTYDYFFDFAQVLILLQNYVLLSQLMDKAIEVFPNSPEFFYLKALALIKLKNYEQARKFINYGKFLDVGQNHKIFLRLLDYINKQTFEQSRVEELLKTSAHKCFYQGLMILFFNSSDTANKNCLNNTFVLAALAIQYHDQNNVEKLKQLIQLYPNLNNLKYKNH